jgi:MTH538 TIR-like domain (DUF1863)
MIRHCALSVVPVDASAGKLMDARSPNAGTFKYRAYLSYSHHDRATAEWLHKALERYRVPKPLVGTPGRDGPIPRQLFPIFRDRDELSSSPDLSTSIREALEQSAYLIVLCSPAAAKSRWVNQEIVSFNRLGRTNRIHALVIDGEPNAGPAEGGCFPPALLTTIAPQDGGVDNPAAELIAADLRPEGDGKDDAKLKLIAGLLGISFNSLRRREVVAARQRLRMTQAIAASIVALTLGVGIAGWTTWYFRTEADIRQIPGVRVEKRTTTLDLAGWRETSEAEIAGKVKKSSAFSTDRYTLVKTNPQAQNYVHIVGTSSAIPPDVTCERCMIVPRYRDEASRTPYEYRVIFDISSLKLEERTDFDYTTTFWNAFQTPQQWWGGFRVLFHTEVALYTIIFPPAKHPLAKTLDYYYVDTSEHPYGREVKATLDTDEGGRVSKVTWEVPYPITDRIYAIRWNWNED